MNLRVHVAVVGFDPIQRVIKPLIEQKADRVYLVTRENGDEAAKEFRDIKKELTKRSVEVRETFVDLWSLMSCMKKFREIVFQEKGNKIYFNLSTGSKIACIAGMLTCMIHKQEPYYAKGEYVKPPEKIGDVVSLPAYGIITPGDDQLAILKIIKLHQNKMRKKELIDELKKNHIIKSVNGSEIKIHAAHGQLNTLIKPLLKEQYIEVETRGKNSVVKLIQQGLTALDIFGER